MSSTGLLDIKRRIKTVQSTQKITKAMALVSTSKLRRAKIKLEKNNKYFSILEKSYTDVMNLCDLKNSVYFNSNNSEKLLYIIITSNSGLCGNFNSLGAQYINEKSESCKDNVSLIVIGDKGKIYANKYGLNIYKIYNDFGEELPVEMSSDITREIMKQFRAGEFKKVSLVYLKSLSVIKDTIIEEVLLPIEIKKEKYEKEIYNSEISSESLLDGFLYKYIEGKIINAAVYSKVSEQSSRMNAMNSATKSGDKILATLKAKYNRIRQSAITEEISEIIGGTESQNN